MARDIELLLKNSGMTKLHRAGLGGLYMTLKTLEKKRVRIEGLDWETNRTSITLHFRDGNVYEAFQKLVNESFKIDEQGFFNLPGLDFGVPMPIEYKYYVYQALRGTFLEHPQHCKLEKDKKVTLTYEIDEKLFYIKDFTPLQSYQHQKAAREFIDPKGEFRERVTVKGWLFPGGIKRHEAIAETCLSEPPELALCLLYAPIGVVYFQVKSRALGRKVQTAVVIPDVEDLEEYSDIRESMQGLNILSSVASGPLDAGLKYLLGESIRKSMKRSLPMAQAGRCTVIGFGKVQWSEQKIRTYITQLSEVKDIKTYELANMFFQNRWQLANAKKITRNQDQEEHYFEKVPIARELVAENCVLGKPWYFGLSEAFTNKDLRNQLWFEGEGFWQMLDKTDIGDRERNFVLACQESWRRRMGQLGQRAKKENSDFGRLVSREKERLRSSLVRCKNAESLREVVVDFWSKAGSLEVLQENWYEVMRLFSNSDWRKARDLALLALVSYKPVSIEEKEAWASTNEGGDGE